MHSETPTDAVHLPHPLLPGFNPDPSCVQVGVERSVVQVRGARPVRFELTADGLEVRCSVR